MRICLKISMTFLLCWVSFCTAQVLPQNSTCLRIGGNVSHFRHETHQYRPGFQLGFGREWQKGKHFAIGWDVLASFKSGFYNNIKVGISHNDLSGFCYDLAYNLVFLETNFYLKKTCKTFHNKNIFVILGPGFQVGISDESTIKRLYYIQNIDRLYVFDHVYSQDPKSIIGFAISGGVGLSFGKYSIELHVVRALYDIDAVSTVAIGKDLDSVSLILSIRS